MGYGVVCGVMDFGWPVQVMAEIRTPPSSLRNGTGWPECTPAPVPPATVPRDMSDPLWNSNRLGRCI